MGEISSRNPELYVRMKALVERAISIMTPDLLEAWDIRTQILHKRNPFFYTLLSTSKPSFKGLVGAYKR